MFSKCQHQADLAYTGFECMLHKANCPVIGLFRKNPYLQTYAYALLGMHMMKIRWIGACTIEKWFYNLKSVN